MPEVVSCGASLWQHTLMLFRVSRLCDHLYLSCFRVSCLAIITECRSVWWSNKGETPRTIFAFSHSCCFTCSSHEAVSRLVSWSFCQICQDFCSFPPSAFIGVVIISLHWDVGRGWGWGADRLCLRLSFFGFKATIVLYLSATSLPLLLGTCVWTINFVSKGACFGW